jgi:membrane-anchored protein YejM (alkaline phosphatase superfamily)
LTEAAPLCRIPQNSDDYVIAKPGANGDAYFDILMTAVLNFIDSNKDNAFFVGVLCNPDFYGHRDGSKSDRYYQEVERCDADLGRILSKLESLGIRDKTRIIIASDHGFDIRGARTGSPNSKTHLNAPWSILITDLPVKRRGTLRDIPVTVYDYLDIDTPTDSLNILRGNSLLEEESLWRTE